nr:MAG TPA: hypothetical protein [Caudoviricetes sp.]
MFFVPYIAYNITIANEQKKQTTGHPEPLNPMRTYGKRSD